MAANSSDANTVPQQAIEIPNIQPPTIEFAFDGSLGFLKRPSRQLTEFLCTVEWSWSSNNERMESYYLQRSRTHWVLWKKQFDDNWGRWEKPFAIARCNKKALGEASNDAAMALLVAVFNEERRRFSDPDRFDITDEGSLSLEEIEAVADTLWGKEMPEVSDSL